MFSRGHEAGRRLATGVTVLILSASPATGRAPSGQLPPTLSVLGIFLASVFAQFVIATDLAMVGVALLGNAVGGSDARPASGGVFRGLNRQTSGTHRGNLRAWGASTSLVAMGGS